MSKSSRRSKRPVRRAAYPSDVTNRQWEEIDQLIPPDPERGRKRKYSLREIVNAINYRWLTGCSWRMLPHDLPHWQTVYSCFRRWQRDGLLSSLREILISRSLRMTHPLQSSSRSSERLSGHPTAAGPAARPGQATSDSDRDTSSWPAQTS